MDEKRIKGVLFDFDGTLTLPGALDFPAIKRELNCPPDIPILEYLETVPAELKPPLMKIWSQRKKRPRKTRVPMSAPRRAFWLSETKAFFWESSPGTACRP